MRWQHRFIVVSVAAWLLALLPEVIAPALGQTAQDALKVVPERAAGFVIVANLDDLSSKIEALAKRVGIPLPFSPLDKLKSELGVNKGLNTKGSLLLVALMPKGARAQGEAFEPIPLVYVPVMNYQEFIQSLGTKGPAEGGVAVVKVAGGAKEMIAGQKGSFAVLTEPSFRKDLTEALQAAPAASQSLAVVGSRIVDNDVTGVLTARGIKVLADEARGGLAKTKDVGLPAEQAQFLEGWLKAVDSFLKSAESDLTHLLIGCRLNKAGNVEFGAEGLFAPGSGFAKAGAKAKSPEGGHFAGLPNVPFLFAFSGSTSGDLMREMMNFSVNIVTAAAKDVPAEKAKQLQHTAGQIFTGLRGFSMIVGVAKGQQSLFQNSSVIMKVADADAYFKNYEEYLEAYGSIVKDIKFLEDFPNQVMKSKRTKVDGLPALEVTAEFGQGNQNEIVKKMMEFYFGAGGKMVVTTVALDKNTLLMRYTPPDETKQFLMELKTNSGGLIQNKDLAKTMALLPTGSQWLAFVSPRGSIAFVNQVMAVLPQAGGMQLPEFPFTPPLGFGVRMTAAGLESRLVIPGGVVDSIGPYIRQFHGDKGAVGASP
jgi:hypothetical protein